MLYVFLEKKAKLAEWFSYPKIYNSSDKMFKIPMKWRIQNPVSTYTFKIPSADSRGVYVGSDDNYMFYLRHVIVTEKVLDEGIFLILLDLVLELKPEIKEQVEAAARKGERIDYLKSQQPSYNVLCPIWQ